MFYSLGLRLGWLFNSHRPMLHSLQQHNPAIPSRLVGVDDSRVLNGIKVEESTRL